MLNKNNPYFMELAEISRKWEADKKKRLDEKHAIMDQVGWETSELHAWYEREETFKYPIPTGASKAWRAWRNTIREEREELLLETHLCDGEAAQFVEALRKAEIQSFIYADESTAVMRNIHELVAAGCTLDSLQVIVKEGDEFTNTEEIPAIRFTIG